MHVTVFLVQVSGALYEMPNSDTPSEVPFKLPTALPAMQGLKFKYGNNEFDMQKPEVNNMKVT